MTSFAFILGVVPLDRRRRRLRNARTLGIAVFSGMLGVTFFGIFLTPVFYYVIQWFTDLRTVLRSRNRRSKPGWFSKLKAQPAAVPRAAAEGHVPPEDRLAAATVHKALGGGFLCHGRLFRVLTCA